MEQYFDKAITGFAVYHEDNKATLLYCPVCFARHPSMDDVEDEQVVVLHPGGEPFQCNFCSRPVN